MCTRRTGFWCSLTSKENIFEKKKILKFFFYRNNFVSILCQSSVLKETVDSISLEAFIALTGPSFLLVVDRAGCPGTTEVNLSAVKPVPVTLPVFHWRKYFRIKLKIICSYLGHKTCHTWRQSSRFRTASSVNSYRRDSSYPRGCRSKGLLRWRGCICSSVFPCNPEKCSVNISTCKEGGPSYHFRFRVLTPFMHRRSTLFSAVDTFPTFVPHGGIEQTLSIG